MIHRRDLISVINRPTDRLRWDSNLPVISSQKFPISDVSRVNYSTSQSNGFVRRHVSDPQQSNTAVYISRIPIRRPTRAEHNLWTMLQWEKYFKTCTCLVSIYIHNSDLTDVWLPPCELHFKTPFATRQSNMNLNYYVSLHLLLHNCTVFFGPKRISVEIYFPSKITQFLAIKKFQFKKCKLFYSFLLVSSFALACQESECFYFFWENEA